MNIKRIAILVVVVAALAGGGYAIYRAVAAGEEAPAGEEYVVQQGELVEMASASGTIQPDVQVEVKSRASGEVTEVHVTEGQEVQAGDLLFKLDPTDAQRTVSEARTSLRRVQADLGTSRSTLAVAEAEAANAETTSDVNRRGVEAGVISTEASRGTTHAAQIATATVGMRRSQVTAAAASLQAARLAVDEAERRLAETSIFASIAGTVLAVNVERGSIVASGITSVSGGTALATIADLSDLRVIGALDEAQIGRVAVGQAVTIRVDAYPLQTFTGRVERVSPLGQTVQNVVTFDVEIVVTDSHANLLRSGMSADVEIETRRRDDAVLVPLLAIQSVGAQRFVTLASGERREIQTGETDGNRIAVLHGLEVGERILLASGAGRGAVPAQAATKSLIPMGRPHGGGEGPPH